MTAMHPIGDVAVQARERDCPVLPCVPFTTVNADLVTARDIVAAPAATVAFIIAGAALGTSRVAPRRPRRPSARLAGIAAAFVAFVVGGLLVTNSVRVLVADITFRASLERYAQGQLSGALDLVSWSTRVAPERPEYHALAATYLTASGQLTLAAAEYGIAVGLGATDASIFRRAVDVHVQLGDFDGARALALRAKDLNPFDRESNELFDRLRGR